MSKLVRVWRGQGYNKNVSLREHEHSDGSIHYVFYPRVGNPANPTKEEAEEIVKKWGLKEV